MAKARRTIALPLPVTPQTTALTPDQLVQTIFDLRNAGRGVEAEPLIAEVLENTDHPARQTHQFWRALAIWSADAHHHESVRDALAEVIKLGPKDPLKWRPEPFAEYALALMQTGDWTESIRVIKMGLDLLNIHGIPDHHPTAISLFVSRANAYLRSGQVSNARTFLRRAIAQADRCRPESRYMLGQAKTMLDHDIEGFRLAEARFSTVTVYQWDSWHTPKMPRWYAGMKGRVVFWQEQGAGDLLMMLRYVPLIAASAGEPCVVRCDPPLWDVVREFDGIAAVVSREDAVDADYELPILSAPLAFGCTGWQDVPPPICPESLRWTKPNNDRPVIGLCWSGAKGHPNDRDRSLPLKYLDLIREKAQAANVQYQALQPGDVPYWMAPLPEGDYRTTVEAIKRCDAVWTVDTSVVHLAATMGAPTICIPPASSEWRWGLGFASPYYPNLMLRRRKAVEQWANAIQTSIDWVRTQIGRPYSKTRNAYQNERAMMIRYGPEPMYE